jgi:hypothetical protein
VDKEVFNIDYLRKEAYHNKTYLPVLVDYKDREEKRFGVAEQKELEKEVNITSVKSYHSISTFSAKLSFEGINKTFKTLIEKPEIKKIWRDKKVKVCLYGHGTHCAGIAAETDAASSEPYPAPTPIPTLTVTPTPPSSSEFSMPFHTGENIEQKVLYSLLLTFFLQCKTVYREPLILPAIALISFDISFKLALIFISSLAAFLFSTSSLLANLVDSAFIKLDLSSILPDVSFNSAEILLTSTVLRTLETYAYMNAEPNINPNITDRMT